MNEISNGADGKRRNYGSKEREQLLEEFRQSGLSGAEFCRRHSIKVTTFYYWRRLGRTQSAPNQFIEVELARPARSSGLEIELGPNASFRLTDKDQIGLAAALVNELSKAEGC